MGVDRYLSLIKIMQHGKLDLPLVYRFNSFDKQLCLIGVEHVRSEKHDSYQNITDEFMNMQADLLVIEGFSGWSDSPEQRGEVLQVSQKQLGVRYGEMGCVLRKAIENNVSVACFEPKSDLDFEYFISNSLQEQAIGYLLLRNINQYAQRVVEFKNPDVFFQPIFNDARVHMQYQTDQESAQGYISYVLKKYLDYNIDWSNLDIEYLNWLSAPVRFDRAPVWSVFNEVASVNARHREEAIVCGVMGGFGQYNKICMVYGASHVVWQKSMWEQYFRDMSGSQRCLM